MEFVLLMLHLQAMHQIRKLEYFATSSYTIMAL
nr:MAG TPA: hypothetical protein [Caudoviricetes sp.]DAG64861.1 MAG TPA: hypothetical protein [Caudoviricetes sp.]DAH23899.1 MAG TPA: hypothetical protein [Bacteriophage sp.]DAH44978.1 MAG TPA: hypothetical protein [Caudoviricetes sp.]